MLRYELIQKEMVECSQTSKSKEQSIKIKIILNIAFIFCCSSFVVVVVALLFYVHGKHLWSCRDGQLT